MAATSNLLAYGTAVQLACGIASLAAGSARESASTTNSSTKVFDYEVQLTFTIASGSPSTTGPYVNVWAVGTGQDSLWPIVQLSSGATKTLGAGDSSVGALGSGSFLSQIGTFSFQTTTSSAERTFRTEPYSLALGFNGVCPYNFSIIVDNQTGVAFSTSTVTTAAYLSATPAYTTSGN